MRWMISLILNIFKKEFEKKLPSSQKGEELFPLPIEQEQALEKDIERFVRVTHVLSFSPMLLLYLSVYLKKYIGIISDFRKFDVFSTLLSAASVVSTMYNDIYTIPLVDFVLVSAEYIPAENKDEIRGIVLDIINISEKLGYEYKKRKTLFQSQVNQKDQKKQLYAAKLKLLHADKLQKLSSESKKYFNDILAAVKDLKNAEKLFIRTFDFKLPLITEIEITELLSEYGTQESLQQFKHCHADIPELEDISLQAKFNQTLVKFGLSIFQPVVVKDKVMKLIEDTEKLICHNEDLNTKITLLQKLVIDIKRENITSHHALQLINLLALFPYDSKQLVIAKSNIFSIVYDYRHMTSCVLNYIQHSHHPYLPWNDFFDSLNLNAQAQINIIIAYLTTVPMTDRTGIAAQCQLIDLMRKHEANQFFINNMSAYLNILDPREGKTLLAGSPADWQIKMLAGIELSLFKEYAQMVFPNLLQKLVAFGQPPNHPSNCLMLLSVAQISMILNSLSENDKKIFYYILPSKKVVMMLDDMERDGCQQLDKIRSDNPKQFMHVLFQLDLDSFKRYIEKKPLFLVRLVHDTMDLKDVTISIEHIEAVIEKINPNCHAKFYSKLSKNNLEKYAEHTISIQSSSVPKIR